MSRAGAGIGGGLGALAGGLLGAWIGLELLPPRSQKEMRRSNRGPSGITDARFKYQMTGMAIGATAGGLIFGAVGAGETPKLPGGAP